MTRTVFAVSLIAVMLAPAMSAAQGAPPGCKTPMHRQFDFWLGEWTVRDSARTVVMGRNSITLEDAGCTVHEHWTAGGSVPNTGQSLNAYDAKTGKWVQAWVGSGGDVLQLRGEFRDGRMVLESEGLAGANGSVTRQRITWTPMPDGRVRQLWQSTTDDGRTWVAAFDGWYEKSP
jgi:hypothetical protein